MLWACLRFPELALDAIRIGDDDPDIPFAVVDGPMQRRQVVLANAAACRLGVRNGQPLPAAQALCPRLSIASRDAAAERQALASIAAWAYRFSADVSIAAPDAIYIEIGASLTLFGGLAAVLRRLRFEIAVFGFRYSLAAAATATAAHVLATQADGVSIPGAAMLVHALGAASLVASGLKDDAIAALRGMGFRNLRDLFRLPRVELARRIGQDALDHLDRMRGIAPETLIRYRPPAEFERRIEFSFGVESQTALAFALQRLVRELAAFLVARDGGVQRFSLAFGHERGAITRVDVGLIAPQRDAASLFELARERLDRIELVAPVHALTLRADDLPPLCPRHRELFDEHRGEALDWSALIERLRARLGDETLHGLSCFADHRPSRAWRFVAIDLKTQRSIRNPPANMPHDAAIDTHHRPFWLLRKPIILRVEPTRILAGPERIESGWWDEHDKRRDYYVVETGLGQRAWAFVPAESQTGWTLHGWFA